MVYEIQLNKEIFHLNEDGLPCLVHYKAKMGGSQFTVTLIADLFLQGSKVLFLTAYPMAKDNFLEQTKGMESKIFFVEKKEDLAEAQKYQAIILKSGDGSLYLEALKSLTDLKDRVILVKNFEMFDQNVLDSSIMLEKIIFSGDIDKSVAKKQISSKLYKTIIMFSESETPLPVQVPSLEKYTGYLKTANKEGLVKLKM
jgi:hypothetical protein